ncbi:Zn-ribbon domain-containing protein [Halorubrum halophilum]|uniref:Zn-ribbon domain-containing protein n=1 Tax=Halorubrum halophilum TaxID=413816 RepID=UPI00186AF257|nr:Zn-ribbon containing protein [Halorubrum halophilum]
MPHQCTTCGRTFPDGSKEMLSGCPDCGGNKFQFKPAGASADDSLSPAAGRATGSTGRSSTPAPDRSSTPAPDQSADSDQPEDSDHPTNPDQSADHDRQTTTQPSASPPEPAHDPDSEAASPDSEAASPESADDQRTDSEHIRDRSEEDVAQASARSDVVSPDELDRASRDVDADSSPESDPAAHPEGHRPDIDDLRDELNEQFESIRIVSPGKYELNLMELYDRQEYIISLQEDGRYVIEMPDAWGISDE